MVLLLGGQTQDFNGPSSTEILILTGVRVRIMVFNGTFNNISVIQMYCGVILIVIFQPKFKTLLVLGMNPSE